MTASITSHQRVNTGVLAALEKRTLQWLARRLPSRINSDHLTLLALFAMAGAGVSFALASIWPPALVLVVVCLALNWFGDSLDGTLARIRQHERPNYGYYVDHVLDIAGAAFLFGGMALSGYMTPVMGLAVLIGYLLVTAEVFLATAVRGTFRMSFLKVGPTELRVLLSVGALTALWRPAVTPFGSGPFLLFDVGGMVAALGMLVAFVTSAASTTTALFRAEPLPGKLAAGAQPHRAPAPHAQRWPQQTMPVPPRAAALVPYRVRRGTVAGLVLVAVLAPRGGAAATLSPETVKDWNAYVAATETRIGRELQASKAFLVSDFLPEASDTRARLGRGEIVAAPMRTCKSDGKAMVVNDGLVSHWRGAVFLPGLSLDVLLTRLQHPDESGPHQEDVLALRVLDRHPDELSLGIRMTRRKIVTVTYDTEHRIHYARYDTRHASSRSVATKIAELEGAGTPAEREKGPGEDRGFMWRLNSYWRYTQVDGGVIVELESLTLSRTIPLGLTPVVQPIIDRIARESMTRTLENLRKTYRPAPVGRRTT